VKRHSVIIPVADIVVVVGIMSFLWFVSSCYMAAGWSNALDATSIVKSGVEASITFSFFSTLLFVSMSFS